jgi:apolipoprotein N-acyltransferase
VPRLLKNSSILVRLAPLLSGALWVLCFPKADLGWLAWVALVPLFWSLERAESISESVEAAFLAGLLFYAGLMQWIFTTCRTAGVAIPWAAAGWLGLAFVMALHWALFGLGVAFFRKLYGGAPAAGWAALWVAIEWLSARFTTRFPWGLAGYTQWRSHWLLPTAGAFGVYGLSFLVVCVNAAIARTLAGAKGLFSDTVLSGAAAACFVFLGLALGPGGAGPEGNLEVAILQGNVDQYRKWDASFEQSILVDYAELVKQAAGVPLVVWPESALPGWYDDPRYQNWLQAVAKKSSTFHIVGVVTHVGGEQRNSAVLLGPEGQTVGFYHKRQLVPFGETIPFDKWLGKHIPVLNELGHMTAGPDDQTALRNFWAEFGIGICYEAIFPHLFRERATEGARVLVNLTNDGWYLDTAGPYQHFAMSVVRAAEERAYLIRAANTGISALVDPWGRVLAQSKIGERTVLRAKLNLDQSRKAPSLYAMVGDMFPAICLAGVAMSLLLGVSEAKAGSSRKRTFDLPIA